MTTESTFENIEVDQSLNLKRDTLFDWILLNLATGIFGLLILLVGIQILVRESSISFLGSFWWTQPSARILLIIDTFLGAAVVTRNDENVRISIFIDFIAERFPDLGRWMQIFNKIIIIAVSAIVAIGLINNGLVDWNTPFASVSFATIGIVTGSMAVGFLLIIIFESVNLLEQVREVL